jgi:hypothetical protein
MRDDESQRSLSHHRALAVATAVLSYRFYQERQKATGFEINVGRSGISIEKK